MAELETRTFCERLVGLGLRKNGLMHLIVDAHPGATPFSIWLRLACDEKHAMYFEHDVEGLPNPVNCLACLVDGGRRW